MSRKPGETLQVHVARIRQDYVSCGFAFFKNSQDEALRSRYICSVNNEAVLKALLKSRMTSWSSLELLTLPWYLV